MPLCPSHEVYDSGSARCPAYACDVHVHTLFSRHAYSTLGECVTAARAAGIELLGVCDHYSAMISTAVPQNPAYLRDYQHFINASVWPRYWDGVYVMRGAEVDIVDLDGHLFGWDIELTQGITATPFDTPHTLKDQVWWGLDYAVASVHNASFTWGATLVHTTRMYVSALEDPKVLILGHPGRSGVPFELDPVLTAARDLGKLIEINEHSFAAHYGDERHAACRRIAERCAELGVMISTATDAHIACDVGRYDAVPELLAEVHFPPELVATRSKESFLEVCRRM